jgi:hypothetical protein
MIDFDGSHQVGYEFSVSITGSLYLIIELIGNIKGMYMNNFYELEIAGVESLLRQA